MHEEITGVPKPYLGELKDVKWAIAIRSIASTLIWDSLYIEAHHEDQSVASIVAYGHHRRPGSQFASAR